MKIILREHVEHLGERGDTVKVAAGYARNYLLPKGLAYQAGAGAARQLEDQKRAWATREAKNEEAAQELGRQVSSIKLEVRRRAGDSGTLYGSVTNGDIAELLSAAGHDVARRRILVSEPIKSLGTFSIQVKLHRSVVAEVPLVVLTERGQSLEELEADKRALDLAEGRVAPSDDVDDDDDDDDQDDERDAEKTEAANENSESTEDGAADSTEG